MGRRSRGAFIAQGKDGFISLKQNMHLIKNFQNTVIDLLSIKLQLDLIQAAFEWDKKNPWVERGEGGWFTKNNSDTQNSKENQPKLFLAEKLKQIKNDIYLNIKKSLSKSSDIDREDEKEGDDIIEKLQDELGGEVEEDKIKKKYLELLKEKSVPLSLTAAALVALAALLVVTKNRRAADEIRNIVSKEGIETFGISPDKLISDIEGSLGKNLPEHKIKEWSNSGANLQKVINEGGVKFLHKSKSIDDSSLLVKGVKEGQKIKDNELTVLAWYFKKGYKGMNGVLRNDGYAVLLNEKDKKSYLDAVNDLRTLLSKLPRYKPTEPIARMLEDEKLADIYTVGETYIEPGFSSCSKKSSGTGIFADKLPSLPIKIIVKPVEKSAARDVSMFNGMGETEVIYPPGMKFKVVRKGREKFEDFHGREFERWVVEVEEQS